MTTRVRTTSLIVGLLLVGTDGPAPAASPVQACEAAVERVMAQFASCRLNAEATFTRDGDSGRHQDTLIECDSKSAVAFHRAILKYGPADCPATPKEVFTDHLGRCSDDVVAAARGLDLPTCGDGLLNDVEELCDGSDLDGESCLSLGFLGGTLACSSDCGFDTSGCESRRTPATGLSQCWDSAGVLVDCAGTGQDGEYQLGGPLAYVDNGDGTITDSNTGLQWEKLSDDGGIHDKDTTYTLADAEARIDSLNAAAFAGHTDWRTPNIRELLSLLDYAANSPAVAEPFYATCTAGCSIETCSCVSQNWTLSSTVKGKGAYADTAVVSFRDGSVYRFNVTAPNNVRAVRGGAL